MGHYIVQSVDNLHASEIVQLKNFPSAPDALLLEDWAAMRIFYIDQQHCNQDDRRKHDERNGGTDDVKRSLAHPEFAPVLQHSPVLHAKRPVILRHAERFPLLPRQPVLLKAPVDLRTVLDWMIDLCVHRVHTHASVSLSCTVGNS